MNNFDKLISEAAEEMKREAEARELASRERESMLVNTIISGIREIKPDTRLVDLFLAALCQQYTSLTYVQLGKMLGRDGKLLSEAVLRLKRNKKLSPILNKLQEKVANRFKEV